MSPRPAVFLDRDGTIVHDVHYLSRPEQLVLIADAADAMQRMAAAGLPLVVITNQSGIGRGMLTEADFTQITATLDTMLSTHGITLLATYHCPDTPDVPQAESCRKPGDSMYRRAAGDHDLDLSTSFYIGDRWRDIVAAVTHGGTGILVPTPETAFSDLSKAKADALVATTLSAAADRVIRTLAQRR